MDILPANDFNFDDLDIATMNSLMTDGVDIFSQQYSAKNFEVYNEQDIIDEFLNLNQDKKDTGIYVESQKPKEKISAVEIKQRQLSVKAVQSDHDYSCATDFMEYYDSSEKLQHSPTNLSDSGVSSASGSPVSDRSENGSPCQQTDLVTETFAEKSDEKPAFVTDDLMFDMSDMDMDQTCGSTTDSPFQIDLSSLFTQSTYDAAPADADLSDLGIFGNEFDACKPRSGYESSAESTTSRDGVVSLDMEKIRAKKSKQTVQAYLPNFTPLVLTDEEKKLLTCEGVSLPTDLPLTRCEERTLKKIRRKIRNKQSAMTSRQKKKDYVSGLEARVAQSTDLNQTLAQRVKQLELQNTSLMEQLRKVHDLVKHTSTKSTHATTCVMVLLLSFGLFLAPSYGPFSINSDDADVEVPEGHRSRKVLAHPTIEDVKKFNENLVMGANSNVFNVKPVVNTHMTHNDRTLTLSMDIADISAKLAKHENDSSDNASLPSNDAAFSVPMTLDGGSEPHQPNVVRPVLPNQNHNKVNIANGQISTSIKIESRVQDGGGGIVEVADPVVTITGNDEM